MKWTRQRCQVAPLSTLLMAAFSPSWLSLITSCTPFRPRPTRLRRNSLQNGSLSLAPVARPSTRRSPVSQTPMAITAARLTMRWFWRTFR